jgi:hypothetical protein
LNPGRRGGKPATNRLSYGAANQRLYLTDLKIKFHLTLSEKETERDEKKT